jgi:signal transduction histidine kinase
LVENAQVHSPLDSAIQVTVEIREGSGVVHVESAGAVAVHVQKNLFRRFVTTRGDRGGTGLGLAIVRAVAEAHSGQVELALAGPPRVAFELRLPLA